ncbi:MAG: nucleotidyl transferase AbiEii/AbiGii toxin family protein [bacterium]|nr:nucleotidyl transferase AbiEii/AbiGii toxin family protein [bacterium]
MHNVTFNPLQKREIFHLAFLRALARSVPLSAFVVKGGGNLRFFFGSIRYSEDMDLDAAGIEVHVLRDKVMAILTSSALADTLRTFGIERIEPPAISRAKQTETVQRFKVHLITSAGEDLSTKVEFSRRGLDSPLRSEAISASVLAAYRMTPLIAPHYTAPAAVRQKIRALASRHHVQGRDIFDLYMLSTHPEIANVNLADGIPRSMAQVARERIFAVGYEQYRDTVVAFLGPEDRAAHDSSQIWDEIRLRAVALLEQRAQDDR